ncbi:Uncharacterised protein [Mycobacteroides abscessus subsp. abscessus]|uniref:hypothetical protein n=1 Tax=Mycobacteroides abscessus TaxID=36809 RepID=UPI00092BB1A5|nr:hypothetical protein [Mycobacteroides abscessus]SIJ20462.1 Uncharacterised protein [Mycobacteroides abscessus subsp. abscessus]SLH39782.1 Uncharacterised protein [Mycobacteroides abscessus subsp. abscessus]
MTAALDRYVLIAASSGTFTPSGASLAGPVDCIDKLEKLIGWASSRGYLQCTARTGQSPAAAARIWVVGAAVAELAGRRPDDPGRDADAVEEAGQALGALITRGWEVRSPAAGCFELSHGRADKRITVEVVLEQTPWLAAGNPDVANDPTELGYRLIRWHGALQVVPGTSGAASAAAVLDEIRGARLARRTQGAAVTAAGPVPDGIDLETRMQPAWTASAATVQRAFDGGEHLVALEQVSGQLASAGMLTFGHGPIQRLAGAPAAAAAGDKRPPFALWHATLPAGDALDLPAELPLPHPRMRHDDAVPVWLTTEGLNGLCAAVRDGGAGVGVEQLNVDEAVIWSQQGRLLDAWAARLRDALDSFSDHPDLAGLLASAAAEYLEALQDPQAWESEDLDHHLQPVWLAAIADHGRFRGRRAAMRISREYRAWPLYVHAGTMVYALGRDEKSGQPIDISDTHTRLGRLSITARAEIDDNTILAAVAAESPSELAQAFRQVLEVPSAGPDPAVEPQSTETVAGQDDSETGATDAVEEPANEQVDHEQTSVNPPPDDVLGEPPAGQSEQPATAAGPRSPAAVLHTDGLWLADGTHVQLEEPIQHVGQVAELAYTYNLGYQITAKWAEPGQIWITEEACRQFGIDVEAINRRDRAKSLRELTEGLDFITLAVSAGWRLGGAGDDLTTQRLGAWTRVYREGQRGVMIALIPGMSTHIAEMPILADEPSPAAIALRLQLLADALKFPWKIFAGVTAIDLMLQARPRTWSPQDWREVVFAPSTTTVPFGMEDIESDFDWSRPPTAEERQMRYVHAYDRSGSYTAGIAGLELPIGAPTHYPEGAVFDPKKPGYHLINPVESADWRLPHLLNPRGLQLTVPKWVCTPRLERALALGYQPQILESYVWHEHGRVLLAWYERFRDANTELDVDDPDAQAARGQSKIIRNHGIGILGSDQFLKGKTGYSPERRLHVVSKASANIVYRLNQIGETSKQWPVAVIKDTVIYVSDDPDPVSAWPGSPQNFGRGFGQYKPEGSGLLAEQLEFLNGRDYRGKQALVDMAQWRQQLAKLGESAGK